MSFLPTGEYLIRLLELYDVEYVFGIPGVHTAELYRGLASSNIRHITPRHEQGAGFMADGYARVSGKPGVCLVITGPGLSNIATAMLQARADSIPMLVISGVNNPASGTQGHLHEMPDQAAFARTVAIKSMTITDPVTLPSALAAAFAIFETERPGPVHIEIPLAVMKVNCQHLHLPKAREAAPMPKIDKTNIGLAVERLRGAKDVVILAGGGARRAAQSVLILAEILNCPVVSTVNARALFPKNHPLVVPASPSLRPIRKLIEQADTVLAIGTELGPTDYDMYETGQMPKFSKLVQVDINQTKITDDHLVLHGLAETIIPELSSELKSTDFSAAGDFGYGKVSRVRTAAQQALSQGYRDHVSLLEQLRDVSSDTIFIGDSTQLVYAGNLYFDVGNRGGWFNSAVGYGTLGYGLPAAIGAKLGRSGQPVIALVGDVGLQFALSELGTLRDLGLPVIIIVWNNNGSGEIKNYMIEHGVKPEGVDLPAPDFSNIACSYAIESVVCQEINKVGGLVKQAINNDRSLLIDIRLP